MKRAEKRSQKRIEVVEANVLRAGPVVLVARIFNVPQRKVFDWLARYRQGGWHQRGIERSFLCDWTNPPSYVK
jgi:transposase